MAGFNLNDILAEVVIVEEAEAEVKTALATIKNNQEATVSAPVSAYGHKGTLTLAWTPANPSTTSAAPPTT